MRTVPGSETRQQALSNMGAGLHVLRQAILELKEAASYFQHVHGNLRT